MLRFFQCVNDQRPFCAFFFFAALQIEQFLAVIDDFMDGVDVLVNHFLAAMLEPWYHNNAPSDKAWVQEAQ